MPAVIHTLEPSPDNTTVAVWTDPPNLVTASGGAELTLLWNKDVASSATQGGIRVQVPADQLESVSAALSSRVQILDGFTNLKSMDLSTSSDTRGVFNKLNNDTELTIEIGTSATASFEFLNVPVKSLTTKTSSHTEIKGNVDSIACSTSSTFILGGFVLTSGELSTSSQVQTTGSCDAVSTSTSAICQQKSEATVSVTVGEPFTRDGTQTCGRSGSSTRLVGLVSAGLVCVASLLLWV